MYKQLAWRTELKPSAGLLNGVLVKNTVVVQKQDWIVQGHAPYLTLARFYSVFDSVVFFVGFSCSFNFSKTPEKLSIDDSM